MVLLEVDLKNIKDNAIDLLNHMPTHLRRYVRCLSFNRWGGVSKKPFHELNVGELTGDNPKDVYKNIDLIKSRLGVSCIVQVRQVHGIDFVHIDGSVKPSSATIYESEADGLFTTVKDIGLMIKTADCQPVVMFDPVKKVVANIHCGWRGSVKGILIKAVSEFRLVYGSNPEDIWVGIGPSLGPCCAQFKGWRELLPEWMADFQPRSDYLNFWQISRHQLVISGIPENQIHCANICTACNQDYFSYRREGDTGRLATVVSLVI